MQFPSGAMKQLLGILVLSRPGRPLSWHGFRTTPWTTSSPIPLIGHNLQYAELNFLWEAWLRQFTDWCQDCVMNYVHEKDLAFYAYTMTQAFQEMYRVLKPGRWASVRSCFWRSPPDEIRFSEKTSELTRGFCGKTQRRSRRGRGTTPIFPRYSTVTLFARLRGLSTSQPRSTAIW